MRLTERTNWPLNRNHFFALVLPHVVKKHEPFCMIFLILQRRVALNTSVNFTFITCLIQSGSIWFFMCQKQKTIKRLPYAFSLPDFSSQIMKDGLQKPNSFI